MPRETLRSLALTPSYRMGRKRILLSNDYCPALAQPNVSLVTEGIKEIRERPVLTSDGTAHHVDTLIFGTGFHVTDFPIARRSSAPTASAWRAAGPPGPRRPRSAA